MIENAYIIRKYKISINLKHVDERKSYIEYQNFASNIKIL